RHAHAACPVKSTRTRTWKAVDNCGNESLKSQSITVTDSTAPVLTVPSNLALHDALPISAVGTASAIDNCDPAPVVTYLGQSRADGACPGKYTLTRTWKAVDNRNNESPKSQSITVTDSTAPVLTVPADVANVECDAVPAVGTASATDNCDPSPVVTYLGQTRADGACPGKYTLTRTWKAVDNCGNESLKSQSITVTDSTAPVLTVPANVANVECDAVPAVATATATDNGDPSPVVTYLGQTRADGACPGKYTLTRTWKAVDNCGNESLKSQSITVTDSTAPVLTVPANVANVECDAVPA